MGGYVYWLQLVWVDIGYFVYGVVDVDQVGVIDQVFVGDMVELFGQDFQDVDFFWGFWWEVDMVVFGFQWVVVVVVYDQVVYVEVGIWFDYCVVVWLVWFVWYLGGIVDLDYVFGLQQ